MSAVAQGESTRARILRAAELLFAAEGFDRVTLRQIARDADQKNVAAVQYHFGSKEGLLQAIVEEHRTQIDDRRAEMLATLEDGEADPDLSVLIRILVEPLAAKLDDPSGRAYLQIQAQGLSNEKMRPATRSLVSRIGRQLGRIAPEADDRYVGRFGLLLLFHALADRAQQEMIGRARRSDRGVFVDSLAHSIEALFAARAVPSAS